MTWNILATRGAFCVIAGAGQEYAHRVFITQSNLQITRAVTMLIISLIIDSILANLHSELPDSFADHGSILAAAISWIWSTRIRALFYIHSLNTSSSEVSILNYVFLACVSSKLLLNLALTGVIARTILWSDTRRKLGQRTPKRFRTITRMMLESCFLGHIAWIVALVLLGLYSNTSWITLMSVLIQIAGMAPTLLIVRASTQDERAKDDSF
ncbi:hypothetical protein PM082_009633 [Marasmius tenuissimus]|nr:hypothetical protein PM082_009633 [Marasmius tenuissimus]